MSSLLGRGFMRDRGARRGARPSTRLRPRAASASRSAGRRGRVVDPLAQQAAAVEHVDRAAGRARTRTRSRARARSRAAARRSAFSASATSRHGRNARVVVRGIVDVDLHAGAELRRRACGTSARTSTGGGGSRGATRARARPSSRASARASRSGAPKSSSGRVVPRPFGERRALEQHRPGIRPRAVHGDRDVRARVHPRALAERPAEARRRRRAASLPSPRPRTRRRAAASRTNQRASSPIVRPCRIGSGPAPTKLSRPARSAAPRRAGRAGFGRSSTQTAFFVRRRRFEHVAERRDERVDAAADVLEVDEQHVERVQHRGGRPAHLAVEAEDRDRRARDRRSPATRSCCPACRRGGRAAGRTPPSRAGRRRPRARRASARGRASPTPDARRGRGAGPRADGGAPASASRRSMPSFMRRGSAGRERATKPSA